jgi:hypothetical protein
VLTHRVLKTVLSALLLFLVPINERHTNLQHYPFN